MKLKLALAIAGAMIAGAAIAAGLSTGNEFSTATPGKTVVGFVEMVWNASLGYAQPASSANPLPVTAVSNSATSVYQEATIITGGTAQNLFSGATPANGFELINTSASEILYFRENGAATSAGAASPALQPGASYISPRGYKPTGPISVIGVTTGHGIVARAY